MNTLFFFILPICAFVLCGCNEKKTRSFDLIDALPVTLIGKSQIECEDYLGLPKRIHNTSPEARSYIKKGLHIQVSFENGRSMALVFRKAKRTGQSNLGFSDSDRELIEKLCGASKERIVKTINFKNSKLEKFLITDDREYLLATDNKNKTITVIPNTPESWRRMEGQISR